MAASEGQGLPSSSPVFASALRFLAGKRLTSAELAKKLQDRGFAPGVIREVVEECKRRRYLDDRTFAQLYVTGALERKPVGPMRLLRDLLKRGIDSGLAREVISEADADEEERLERAIRKLEATRPGDRFDRLARRLVNLGYTAPAVARALRRRAAAGMTIELSIECGDDAMAESLGEVLMPDNRYFPKDQRFEASTEGPVLRFKVSSPRARPALSTVTSIISDSRLFRDIWLEARTRGLGRAPQ